MTKNEPNNIGIIMDGNRRWAQLRGLSYESGYKKGVENFKSIVKTCSEINVKELTVFAFSTENWSRKSYEITYLKNLLELYLKSEIANLDKSNIRFLTVGEVDVFGNTIRNLSDYAKKLTENNNGLQLSIAINYGGIRDLSSSITSILNKINKNELSFADVDEKLIREHLISSNVGDLDIIIRTGGQKRLSNFLLYQSSYSELIFSDTLWPDFSRDEFINIIESFKSTQRNFGSSVQKINK